jgi:protein ImuB
MSAWLALLLPALPLQLARRALGASLGEPLLVITEGPAERACVVCASAAARAAGIAPGLSLAAARARAPGLSALARDPEQEQAALQALAGWALQFSSRVRDFAEPPDGGVLIELAGSARLFGGLERLQARIQTALVALGHQGVGVCAPTPSAARLLARARAAGVAGVPERVPAGAALVAALGPLPIALLGWEARTVQHLQALGMQELAGVLALPRAGLARRFGPALLIQVDRLLGRVPDPVADFVPPGQFSAGRELPADLDSAQALLAPAGELLALLEGYLRGRGRGATAVRLAARHGLRHGARLPDTCLTLAPAAPERDAGRLLALLREHLARLTLPAPATRLELTLLRDAPWEALAGSLLPPLAQAGLQDPQALHLAALLQARLGSRRVFQLEAVDEHRPGQASRLRPPGPDHARPPAAELPRRPTLLLPVPRPLAAPRTGEALPRWGGCLHALAGPERIEAGWWDTGGAPGQAQEDMSVNPPGSGQAQGQTLGQTYGQARGPAAEPAQATVVLRDYYVAANPAGQVLWIYREMGSVQAPAREPVRNWYLHGWFA